MEPINVRTFVCSLLDSEGRVVHARTAPMALVALLVAQCPLVDRPIGRAALPEPVPNPMALSNDGTRLYVANTTSGTLTMLDVSNPFQPSEVAEIKVGHDPVGVAVRPGLVNGDELIFVVNHISDSISVVSRRRLAVVQTSSALTPVTADEPVGIAFASPRAPS
jgi:YVTN family beta-propeller protein